MVTHSVSALKEIVLLSIHQHVPHTIFFFFENKKKKLVCIKSLGEYNPKGKKDV